MPRLPNGHESSVYTTFNRELHLQTGEKIDLLRSIQDRKKFLVDNNVSPEKAAEKHPEYAFFIGGTFINENHDLTGTLTNLCQLNGFIFLLQVCTQVVNEQYQVTIEIVLLNQSTRPDCLNFPSIEELKAQRLALAQERSDEIERFLDIRKSNSMEQLHCDIVNKLPKCRYDAETSIDVTRALYGWLLHDNEQAKREKRNRDKPNFGGDPRIIYEALLLGMGILSNDDGVIKMANGFGIQVLSQK